MAAKQNTPTLVRGVLQKLKGRIGQHENLNMEEEYGSNSISYTLRDYNACSATFQMVGTHEKYVPIVAIREGFNLYASIGYINMGKKKKLVVSSVSFQVFDTDRLLFRAEWTEEPKKDMPHPQPHWHFHPYSQSEIKEEKQPKRFEDTLQGGFQNSLDEEEKKERIDIADMHLTMDYNIASNPYEKSWDEIRIQEWAYKTIDTLFEELDFVISKGHKA